MHVVGLSGYYLILDNSRIYSMREGGGVELITPRLVSDRPFCLTFWYFVKDRDEFRVDLHSGNSKTTIWQRPKLRLGETSKPWTEARVNVAAQPGSFEVRWIFNLALILLLFVIAVAKLSRSSQIEALNGFLYCALTIINLPSMAYIVAVK